MRTIPSIFLEVSSTYPKEEAQYKRLKKGQFEVINYNELYEIVENLAFGLQFNGVLKGDKVALICDNRAEWLSLDLAILGLGAADVPRGCDTMANELEYILGFSECSTVILENEAQLKKIIPLKESLKQIKQIILVDKEGEVDSPWPVIYYSDILERGACEKTPDFYKHKALAVKEDDLATLIYTSGTTGEPKGVMLSHRNFAHQASNVETLATVHPGDKWLSVLPVWHSFERVVQYIAMANGCTICYSKPIGKIMLMDLQRLNPKWMATVPRIWSAIETGVIRNIKAKGKVSWALYSFFLKVAKTHQKMKNRLAGRVADFKRPFLGFQYCFYPLFILLLSPLRALGNKIIFSKIKEKVGRNFTAGICGGGALPPSLYQFFEALGIPILEGYGLTETAPVVAFSPQKHPIMGVVGKPFPGTEIKVCNEKGQTLGPGEKGVVFLRGPQIMKGYFKKPELSNQIIDKEGWLNSGDLGIMTIHNELKIVGREKDTIVLLGGENIEPVPMEQKITESVYIDQAVIVGQDQKYLGALIVPNFDALEAYAKENNLAYENRSHLKDVFPIVDLISSEINRLISTKNGFRSFERIFKFEILRRPFEVGEELSGKQDLKRNFVVKKYKKEISDLF